MAEFLYQEFRRADVSLDGNSYTSCRFIQCDLVFRAEAPFSMKDCTLVGSPFKFDGPAATTLAALSQMYRGGFAAVVDSLFNEIKSTGLKPE